MEEKEQWPEKSEILAELGETFRRRRQCDDGWGGKWWMRQRWGGGENWKRGRTRESNCAVLDTSTENTLASCQSDRLAWLIFSSFQSAFHYASLSPFRMCPDANFQWGFFFPLYILYAARQDQTVTVTSTVLKQQAINILDEELKICLCQHFTNAWWKWKLLFLRRMC